MSGAESIITAKDGGVFFITLNRPAVLNSFDRAMALLLQQAFRDAGQDPSIRAVYLTGAGRAFCAGQDLAGVAPKDGSAPPLGPIVRECYNPIISLMRSLEKPVLCSVNGIAAGAGANLALAADVVVAGESAAFIQSFSRVGLIPDSGGTFTLPRLVGISRATWMTFFGDKISAEEAHRFGMIYRVYPDASLEADSRALARKLAEMPTRGLALTKRAFNESFGNSLVDQLALEEDLQHQAGSSADYAEGVTAFLEKRPPLFKGC